jgi:eukaryotic-like serine/threonine-protein kinase
VTPLKTCPTCGTEYPASERFCPRDGSALRSAEANADLVGQVVAERYHVLQKLGEGGMGQVYLAEHVRMGRRSAVKVMSPNLARDPDAVSRFNREAANASRITHPNVAAIYDFGETSDGLIYLAMEFVDGQPLTKIIQAEGSLPLARAVPIARQTADALTVAHELGIVHRDLKPDNIMIGRGREGADVVKVVDFGIAKASQSEAQKVTRTGMVVGTPEYMSPEQLAGDTLDGRSDIYALGLVTFVMLTGKLPFPSDTAQEAMLMRLMEKPKTLAEMRPDVAWSPELQAVFDKVLARNANDRYAVAADFGADLVRAAQAGGVQVPRNSPYGAVTTAMNAMPPIAPATPSAVPTVPKTRIAPAAEPSTIPRGPGGSERPSAPPPAPPPRRTGLVVGLAAAGLIVVAGGTAFVMSRSPHPVKAGTGSTADSIVHVDTTTPRPPDSTISAKPPVNTTGSGGHIDKPPKPPRRDSSIVSSGPSVTGESPTAALARLSSMIDANQASPALALFDTLYPKLTEKRQLAEALFYKAQAYGTLGKQDEACKALHEDMDKYAPGTPMQKPVSEFLKGCDQ